MRPTRDDSMHGVFGPDLLVVSTAAFEIARSRLDDIATASFSTICLHELAHWILKEARQGETDPELLWRSAVAKMLLSKNRAYVAPQRPRLEANTLGHADDRHLVKVAS